MKVMTAIFLMATLQNTAAHNEGYGDGLRIVPRSDPVEPSNTIYDRTSYFATGENGADFDSPLVNSFLSSVPASSAARQEPARPVVVRPPPIYIQTAPSDRVQHTQTSYDNQYRMPVHQPQVIRVPPSESASQSYRPQPVAPTGQASTPQEPIKAQYIPQLQISMPQNYQRAPPPPQQLVQPTYSAPSPYVQFVQQQPPPSAPVYTSQIRQQPNYSPLPAPNVQASSGTRIFFVPTDRHSYGGNYENVISVDGANTGSPSIVCEVNKYHIKSRDINDYRCCGSQIYYWPTMECTREQASSSRPVSPPLSVDPVLRPVDSSSPWKMTNGTSSLYCESVQYFFEDVNTLINHKCCGAKIYNIVRETCLAPGIIGKNPSPSQSTLEICEASAPLPAAEGQTQPLPNCVEDHTCCPNSPPVFDPASDYHCCGPHGPYLPSVSECLVTYQ